MCSIAVLRKAERTIGLDPLYPPIELPAVMRGIYYHGASRGSWLTLFGASEDGDAEAQYLEDQLIGTSSTAIIPHWTTSKSLMNLVLEKYCSDAEEPCLCSETHNKSSIYYKSNIYYGIDILDPVFGSVLAFGPFFDLVLFDRCADLLNKFGLLNHEDDVSRLLTLYRDRSQERDLEPLSDMPSLQVVSVSRLSW